MKCCKKVIGGGGGGGKMAKQDKRNFRISTVSKVDNAFNLKDQTPDFQDHAKIGTEIYTSNDSSLNDMQRTRAGNDASSNQTQ